MCKLNVHKYARIKSHKHIAKCNKKNFINLKKMIYGFQCA